MNKDVIYIDVDDDITMIVSKIKVSKEKIIALVPPKRVGVLQSAVNMRLLARTAKTAGKRIVLVTGDHALSGLAAAASIPVAKTLQSKPTMAEVPALKVDNDDDIIDGSELPVGELAKTAPAKQRQEDDAVAAVLADEAKDMAKEKASDVSGPKAARKKPVVPDFNIFRKRFALIGGGALLLIGFLVWAFAFAPRATVVITAKTTTVTVNETVALRPSAATNAEQKTLKVLRQEQQQEVAVDFTPTGKKKVGEKAKGKVRVFASSDAILGGGGVTVAAGMQVQSSGGSIFVTTEKAVFPLSASSLSGVVVGVEAMEIGESYNGATGRASASAPGVSSVKFETTTSGGSSREVTVVSAEDVKKATEQLTEKKQDDLKAKLAAQFGSSAVVIQESYLEKKADPTPSVAVDAEATGPVKLSAKVTASLLAVEKADITKFLTDKVNAELAGKKHQKVYNDGGEGLQFAQFAEKDGAYTVRLTTNAVVGPAIDEQQIKEQVKGRSYGDVQSAIEAIEGVKDVDTKFWPFWVRTVPNDDTRITVEFKLENGS
ncbi:MAG: hypothetical protein Q4A34_01580 [Candidatus Saccharibacteria bacterium]|nr:hypothetical protein [Candidatus Saccharibacteria bacterium]